MPDPAESAKPPSPVQIRAAPPFFPRILSVPAGACFAGHSLLLRRSLDSLLGFVARFRKSLRCDELSASDLRRGGGSEDLRLPPRARPRLSVPIAKPFEGPACRS